MPAIAGASAPQSVSSVVDLVKDIKAVLYKQLATFEKHAAGSGWKYSRNFDASRNRLKAKLLLLNIDGVEKYSSNDALKDQQGLDLCREYLHVQLEILQQRQQILEAEQTCGVPAPPCSAVPSSFVHLPPHKRSKKQGRTLHLWRSTFINRYMFFCSEFGGKSSDYSFLQPRDLDLDLNFVHFNMADGCSRAGCQGDCGLPRLRPPAPETIESLQKKQYAAIAGLKEGISCFCNGVDFICATYFHCARCYELYKVSSQPPKTEDLLWQCGIPDNRSSAAFDQHPVHGRIEKATADGAEHYGLTDAEYAELAFNTFLWTGELTRIDNEYNEFGDRCKAKRSKLLDLCPRFLSKCPVCKKIHDARQLASDEHMQAQRALVRENELLHIQYTMSFYWAGSAVELWRDRFKKIIEEKFDALKKKQQAVRERIQQRSAELQASLDADDHEKRYWEAKEARVQRAALCAAKRSSELAELDARHRAEQQQRLQEEATSIATAVGKRTKFLRTSWFMPCTIRDPWQTDRIHLHHNCYVFFEYDRRHWPEYLARYPPDHPLRSDHWVNPLALSQRVQSFKWTHLFPATVSGYRRCYNSLTVLEPQLIQLQERRRREEEEQARLRREQARRVENEASMREVQRRRESFQWRYPSPPLIQSPSPSSRP